MDEGWRKVARRIVQGLGVQPGELIDVRDACGRRDVLIEVSLAVEQAGGTPLLQFLPEDYLVRLWSEVHAEYLVHWDHHRRRWMEQIDRVLLLGGAHPDRSRVPQAALDAWDEVQNRLTVIEEDRRLPYLVVAIPTEKGAQQLGLRTEELDEILMPALGVSVEELSREILQVLSKVQEGQSITVRSGGKYELHLEHGDRPWLSDDGYIDDADRSSGAIVSNLPAGSIYTTVLEGKTEGSLWVPKAGKARDVVFHFCEGRVVEIEAAGGAAELAAELDRHSGEPRRISHIGVGLNPYLTQTTGWTLVDEHIAGNLFVALGENRYMGGQNESSINVDYVVPGTSLIVDGETITSDGKLISTSD